MADSVDFLSSAVQYHDVAMEIEDKEDSNIMLYKSQNAKHLQARVGSSENSLVARIVSESKSVRNTVKKKKRIRSAKALNNFKRTIRKFDVSPLLDDGCMRCSCCPSI